MLASHKMKLVEEIISTFTKEELFWLNGYIAGKFSTVSQSQAETVATTKPSINKLTITYGTESGNSKKLASEFAAKAKKIGINTKLVSLDQYRLNDLPKEECLLSVISTQGEGEPPAAAKKFYDHIYNNSFKLDKLKYGVLALGDTSYPLFCKAGEDVDQQLGKLGGERIVPLQKCDVDYEDDANSWFQQVLHQLNSTATGDSVQTAPVVTKKSTGKKIYEGTIITNINLNDIGSNKQTHHMEIAADELEYLPGDALGVIPQNPQSLVDQVIRLLNLEAGKTFTYRDQQLTAAELLKSKLNIIYLPERVVAKYASLTGQQIPAIKIGLLELLRIYPLKDTNRVEELMDILEPIAPRLYSISSSPDAHSGEIHLTVARDSFTVNDEQKCGLCSDYLTALPEETKLEFYIHKNAQFRLPENEKDVIMVGPGTGIAPFRSFIAHRDATGAIGRNWLFFGDQHFVTDFLYQTELQSWMETGVLTRLNVAFSRDQKEKVYVQHKMLQHGNELYQWLTNGAYLYICGAKEPMSVDVENTLIQIVETFGNKSKDEAIQFIQQLREDGRFMKDVY
jgi:sulfite reductase (NADPH) flavoprotein alpha-component